MPPNPAMQSSLRAAGFKPKPGGKRNLGLFDLSQWLYDPEDTYITVELDLMIGSTEYYTQMLDRSKPVQIVGVSFATKVMSREDLILHKLYAQRLIDIADVANLLENHWDALDHVYLQQWLDRLGLAGAWNNVVSVRSK